MEVLTLAILPGKYASDESGGFVEIEPARVCPELLTSAEAARFLRIDHLRDPDGYLYERRREGVLRGTQIGRDIRYLRSELLRFLERVTENKPR